MTTFRALKGYRRNMNCRVVVITNVTTAGKNTTVNSNLDLILTNSFNDMFNVAMKKIHFMNSLSVLEYANMIY